MLREPHEMPRDDLRTLLELGYASESAAVREAAGRVDTWVSKLSFYLHEVRSAVATYREHTKPAYGPLGDSLDDLK
jgi:hypothetical protein